MDTSLVSFLTPKKLKLNGVWLGSDAADTAFIFLHGLGGSLFSRSPLTSLLAGKKQAVFALNNRGSGTINYFKKEVKSKPTYFLAGVAHEVFTDCVDDIDGAVAYVQQRGAKNIYLLGHSTGCQKSIYYLSKRPHSPVRGAILLAPVSDYASIIKTVDPKVYRRALSAARKLVATNKSQVLLPEKLWLPQYSAQRFLSLFTPDSPEEIFTYGSKAKPVALRRANKPILAILAELDQVASCNADELAAWFKNELNNGNNSKTIIIKGADHGFEDKEVELAKIIITWLKALQ